MNKLHIFFEAKIDDQWVSADMFTVSEEKPETTKIIPIYETTDRNIMGMLIDMTKKATSSRQGMPKDSSLTTVLKMTEIVRFKTTSGVYWLTIKDLVHRSGVIYPRDLFISMDKRVKDMFNQSILDWQDNYRIIFCIEDVSGHPVAEFKDEMTDPWPRGRRKYIWEPTFI